MNLQHLIKHLDNISKITNEEWLSGLEKRKVEELEFHNKHRDEKSIEEVSQDSYEKYYGNKKYYICTLGSREYTEKWIKNNVKNKVFLDYACGNGSNAIFAAKAGASLAIGLDISDISIQNAKKKAREEGVEKNTYFLQSDAENTKLQDSSVDIIVCSGMLHHLDLSYAFPELRRILAPNGKILAIEALDYNPFIKFYRKITPSMRTEWEKNHILSLQDLKFASKFFDIGEIRYWHILGYLGAFCKPIVPILNLMDSILTKLPFIQRMAWIFTFELKSKK